jgi:DNA-3-methyladenine glycosylase II
MSVKYKKHTQALSSRHPKLKKLIELVGPMKRQVPAWDTLNDAVFRAIVSQMLSAQVARSITNRLLERFGNADNVIKWAMKQPPGPAMGLSRNKVRALAEWGKFERKNKDIATRWKSLEFTEYKKDVSKIWGLGPWTADMIAIFHLGRMDVWPAGDAGVVKGAKLVFGTADYDKISKYIKGSETVVCLYFWEMITQKIVI